MRVRLPLRRQQIALLTSLIVFSFLCFQVFKYEECEEPVIEKDIQSFSINGSTLQVPYHPFERGQPRFVIILTYQRCGSTFFGELFNSNPDAFYLFEPLDALYSSIYGTKQGWNVPSDITNYANGTKRILPPEEIEHVSHFLQTLLSCDTNSLPSEAILHRFYAQFREEFLAISKYVRCTRRYSYRTNKCVGIAPWSVCGGRFGDRSEEVLADCRQAMTDATYRQDHPNRTVFDKYFDCMNQVRKVVDSKCVPTLKSACEGRSLRAIKLVRGTMDSMEPLLEALPNLRIIHLIRDPRAVVLSRQHFDSSGRGRYTELNPNETLTREAYLYCSSVVRDVLKREELALKHPGKIFPIIYDDVVTRIKSYVEDVYDFLGLPVPSSVWKWYKQSDHSIWSKNKVNSTVVATKWQTVLTYRENKDIQKVCSEFFRVVDFDWPL